MEMEKSIQKSFWLWVLSGKVNVQFVEQKRLFAQHVIL